MDKIHLYDKILSPMVTEKTTNLSEQNKIVFKVPREANKTNLKKNIEKIFKVNVIKINIINKQNRIKVTRGKKVRLSPHQISFHVKHPENSFIIVSPLVPRCEKLSEDIFLYKGSRVLDLFEHGLLLDACCSGLAACRLMLEEL